MIQRMTIYLFLVGVLISCNADRDHNPLRNYSQAIQQGIPPKQDTPPPPQKPVPQDALVIDADEVMIFQERVETSYTINLRTFKPNLDTHFEVQNFPDDFTGWSYDPITSRLTWTPPANFTGGEYARHFQIMFRYTIPSEGIGTVRYAEIIVYREEIIPQVTSVEWPKGQEVREGEELPLTVNVLDASGGTEPPVLSILDKRNVYERNGAYLVRLVPSSSSAPNPILVANGSWQFNLVFSAIGELSKDRDKYYFAIQATSRFGTHSALASAYAVVMSKVDKPIVSWVDQNQVWVPDAIVYQGQNNLISFTVMAPNFEGKVQLNWQIRCDRDLPGNASCQCYPANSGSVLHCVMDWFVKETTNDKEDYAVNFEVINRGSGSNNFSVINEKRVVRAIKKETVN